MGPYTRAYVVRIVQADQDRNDVWLPVALRVLRLSRFAKSPGRRGSGITREIKDKPQLIMLPSLRHYLGWSSCLASRPYPQLHRGRL